MSTVLAHLASSVVSGALATYYGVAAHRFAAESEALIETERPLHFFRGMCHFEPGDPFVQTLEQAGLDLRIFRFDPRAEKSRVRQWRDNTADVIRHFIAHPEAIGEFPVFVGHSAAGFTVYTLGAIAKGGDLRAIRDFLPGLQGVRLEEMEGLVEPLRDGLYLAIGAPLNGIEMNRPGAWVSQRIVEKRIPGLFADLTRERATQLYEAVGLQPAQVMDGILYSDTAPLALPGKPAAKVANAMIQGGMRFFSFFVYHNRVNDGIVPVRAARIEGIPQRVLSLDHLRMVETTEAAEALLQVIEAAETPK